MSYLALARKWRPRTFSQLVGQDHINKILINSLKQERLHHAYLFTGTRGVGKTSVARLMAKALNCMSGDTAEPCLTCEACLAIEQGRFPDLIEIDGASKTKVEDTRELLDNVQYMPVTGKYKIYLIDEVHMLSQHSFNALLKTLEEPPSHVKFLLATTDPQKLPVTVLSRCLQFHLKHLSPDVISEQLKLILTAEQYDFEEEAIQLLARSASGSMRDALSLLDQAMAGSDNMLTVAELKNVMGCPQQDYAVQLLKALAAFQATEMIKICRKIAVEGGYFIYILNEMLTHLHQIALLGVLGSQTEFLDVDPGILALQNNFTAEDVQLMYEIGLRGLETIHQAPALSIGFEMTLLRMLAFRPAPCVISTINTPIPEAPVVQLLEAPPPSEAVMERQNITVKPEIKKIREHATWPEILQSLNLKGLALTAAENSQFVEKTPGNVFFKISKGHQALYTPLITTRIEQALSEYYQDKVKITLDVTAGADSTPAHEKFKQSQLDQENASKNLQEDPFLQQLQTEFSAELIKKSIEPL